MLKLCVGDIIGTIIITPSLRFVNMFFEKSIDFHCFDTYYHLLFHYLIIFRSFLAQFKYIP